MTVSTVRRPLPRLSALLVTADSEHRRKWSGPLRSVGIGRVLEAQGPNDAVTRGRMATDHGVCVVEAAPQDGAILQVIRELRRQGWHRLVLVSPRSDDNTVRLAMAAKIPVPSALGAPVKKTWCCAWATCCAIASTPPA